ncbi:MAG: C-GCAxxG-C-C family protein, partial [Desulfobacteraceae bacterium]
MDDLLLRITQWGHKGYSCSQILLLLAMEDREVSNPDLVRTMSGLAYGCGVGRATCGALTGGCCLLAYLAVSEIDATQPSEHLTVMLQELSDWFDERVGKAHDG